MAEAASEPILPQEENVQQTIIPESPGAQVIPIRKSMDEVLVREKQALLVKLEDDLNYTNSILNSPNVTDSPRWDKPVKTLMCRKGPLEKEIGKVKAEISELLDPY